MIFFIKKNHQLSDVDMQCAECARTERKWYNERLFQVIIALIIVQATQIILDNLGVPVLMT